MTRARFRRAAAVWWVVASVAAAVAAASAADWPTYRHDLRRSAFTPEPLKTPLHAQWVHVPRHRPRPAWPEPGRELHAMSFDYAYQVAVAGGTVFFGSSADHKVYALDLATGRQRWCFITGAPVRFAPVARGKRLFVASDDGRVYCLSAADGKLLWRFRGLRRAQSSRGPGDEMLLGNEAMISRRPLRSGLVVEDETVYFTAGMWPLEGVYVYALAAGDGKVLWQAQPAGGFAPQGYLAANEKSLVAPAGRASAWVIERGTGKARKGNGHSWAMVRGDRVFSGPPPDRGNDNVPIRGGVRLRPKRRSIIVWDVKTPKKRRGLADTQCAAVSDDTLYAAGAGKVGAYALANLKKKWEVEHGEVFCLAAAANTVLVGGDKGVTLLAADGGRRLWSAPVDGEARGLAVADGRLIVSTHTGRIVCFGPRGAAAPKVVTASPPPPARSDPARAALAGRILQDTRITAGFCLLAGLGDGQLALALAGQSDLRIYCAEPDARKVAAARALLSAAGLYGPRVTVHHVRSKALPYPAYFANLVVVADAAGAGGPWPAGELYRVLRPCGGKAWFPASGRGHAEKIKARLTSAGVPAKEIRATPKSVQVARGPLPGAGQWTHQYGDPGKSGSSGDRLVRWPLKVLWFGKPGPARMMNRHWRGSAPLYVGGRMFLLGQHSVIAVDAYNGRELWSRPMPSINRRVVDIRGGSLAADANSIYLVTADLCMRLDAETGKTRGVYRLPLARPRFAITQPRTFTLGDAADFGELSRAAVAVRNTPAALELALTTTDTAVINADRAENATRGDSWELFFDFRPAERRTGLYGPGAFQAVVIPATADAPAASWRSGVWSSCPDLQVSGRLEPDGTRTTVRVPWEAIRKLVGAQPADFTFGAILNSSDDGQRLTTRSYKFANAASYRLANCWATLALRPMAPGGSAVKAVACEHPESLTWGSLVVAGDVVLGTMVARADSPTALVWGRDFSSQGHDYTGPPVVKVLGHLGLEPQARHVFAVGKNDGRLRWVYTATGGVGHNALAVWGGRVYLIDSISAAAREQGKRRGAPVKADSAIVVLDLATGRRVSQIGQGVPHVGLRMGKGVLLATHLRGMTAYAVEDGRELWSVRTPQAMHHCSAYLRTPVIAGEWVYDEPHAYHLRTGKARLAGPPGGAQKPWRWGGYRGCGTVSAAETMLFYRDRRGLPGMLDVAGGTGGHSLEGIRPGCFINIIAAGGLVLMPEASSGCGCPYNFQTTVALMPKADAAAPAKGRTK